MREVRTAFNGVRSGLPDAYFYIAVELRMFFAYQNSQNVFSEFSKLAQDGLHGCLASGKASENYVRTLMIPCERLETCVIYA